MNGEILENLRVAARIAQALPERTYTCYCGSFKVRTKLSDKEIHTRLTTVSRNLEAICANKGKGVRERVFLFKVKAVC